MKIKPRYEVVIVNGIEDLPEWLTKDQAKEVRSHIEDYTSVLIIRNKDSVLWFTDHGEPEDKYFYRDFSWIEYELRKAYEAGVKDAGGRSV